MAGAWTTQQVEALAPDAASVTAGRKLATPAPWSETGADQRAVWGACHGSGKKPYQAQIDLEGPAFRCSCPSRKFPCKHALGLLLLWVGRPELMTGARPPWVDEWLDSREERAGPTAKRAADADAPPDPAAQAKRVAAREAKVAAGLAELDLWLEDLVRQGLATARQQPYTFWDQAGARLVDAQASGLAGRVRAMGDVAMAGRDGWQSRVLEHAATTELLLRGYQRQDAVPEAARADLRALIGWNVAQADVLRRERVRDRWAVVGRLVVDGELVSTQRTWLWGNDTNRPALVLSFVAPGQVLDVSLVPGTTVDAELAYFPGATPLRALVAEQHAPPEAGASAPGYDGFGAALAAFGDVLAANPFLDRWPMLVTGCRVAFDDDRFELVDADGQTLPVAPMPELGWQLGAVTGGHPCTAFGEWDGRLLDVLGVVADHRFTELR